MLIAGENTVVSDAERKHGEAQLRELDHLVVIGLFMTETAEFKACPARIERLPAVMTAT